jgi:hypothetical protein
MTDNEEKILEILRELKPFETVTVQKDSNGRPDYFIVTREQKIFMK